MSIPRTVMDGRPEWPAVWADVFAKWNPGFVPRLFALYRVGSHSHGTHVPPTDPLGVDDTDYMAIVIPPPERVFGLNRFDHAVVKEGDLDVTVYSMEKYVKLLLKANPNVLGTLWLEPEDAWSDNPYPLIRFRSNRRAFASLKAYESFVGYARAQLYKMTHQAHQGYMGEKRKALVARFGYDVKNAAHLIRLLRMCSEFLLDGEMRVRRNDADELIEIKSGGWSLERVAEEATRLFALCEENRWKSTLPAEADSAYVESLLINAHWEAWGRLWRTT